MLRQLGEVAVAVALAILLLLFLAVYAAYGHDANMAVNDAQSRVYQMYSRWNMPAFRGVKHRYQSCCNLTDCSPVIESARKDGKLYVRVEREPLNWYFVPEEIQEVNQPDPVESEDG